jgi:mRNA interferase MazF
MEKPLLPPRIKPTLKSAPKIRQLYWCDFPKDAQLPELWKNRPVVILSYRNSLFSTVTVVPCTTGESNEHNKWAFPLRTTIDGKPGWAICDKVTTVAVSRLTVPVRSSVIRMCSGLQSSRRARNHNFRAHIICNYKSANALSRKQSFVGQAVNFLCIREFLLYSVKKLGVVFRINNFLSGTGSYTKRAMNIFSLYICTTFEFGGIV